MVLCDGVIVWCPFYRRDFDFDTHADPPTVIVWSSYHVCCRCTCSVVPQTRCQFESDITMEVVALLCYVMVPLLPSWSQPARPGGAFCPRLNDALSGLSITLR
jgi:hypothetical protein